MLWAVCIGTWSAAAFEATIAIEATGEGIPANRMLLGANVQWVDGGDGLLATHPEGRKSAAAMQEAAKELRPTTLRYPGGSQSDTYRWRDGVGSRRGQSQNFFSRQKQEVIFGTDEFLLLAGSIGAKPMLTVNVASGTADEAEAWIRYVNGAKRMSGGVSMPRVDWWELGNEPYLKPDTQPELVMTPDEFVRRANSFIPAMRAADPSILIGLPLRTDAIGGRPATPFPGYNDKVLRGVTAPFDFVAVHDAYAPAVFQGRYSDRDLYLALMASPLQVSEDLAATRAAVRRALGHDLPIAITEWSALFTIGGSVDDYVASLAGALYAADLIRVLAHEPGILAAHYWSLTGNWYFGTVSQVGRKRPVYSMLAALNAILNGNVLPLNVSAPMLATPAVGFVAARADVSAVSALATRERDSVRLMALNKHPNDPVVLQIVGLHANSASLRLLTADSPFSGRDGEARITWTKAPVAIEAGVIRATLPPHSAGLIVAEIGG